VIVADPVAVVVIANVAVAAHVNGTANVIVADPSVDDYGSTSFVNMATTLSSNPIPAT
jgi:hypothetical protein